MYIDAGQIKRWWNSVARSGIFGFIDKHNLPYGTFLNAFSDVNDLLDDLESKEYRGG